MAENHIKKTLDEMVKNETTESIPYVPGDAIKFYEQIREVTAGHFDRVTDEFIEKIKEGIRNKALAGECTWGFNNWEFNFPNIDLEKFTEKIKGALPGFEVEVRSERAEHLKTEITAWKIIWK